MKTIIIIYSFIALINGAWSLKQHMKYNPSYKESWRMVLVFIINSLFFPITIPIAIYKKKMF